MIGVIALDNNGSGGDRQKSGLEDIIFRAAEADIQSYSKYIRGTSGHLIFPLKTPWSKDENLIA